MQAFFEKNVLFFAKKLKKKVKMAYFSHLVAVFHEPLSCVPLKKSEMGMAFFPACCTCVKWMKPSRRAIFRYFLLSVATVPVTILGVQVSISAA